MPNDVTPKTGNVEDKQITDVKESKDNPSTEVNTRYKSVEEAEKAKNLTDKEFDEYTKFVQVMSKEDATSKVKMMYELEPDKTNRFYKRTFGKTYEEALRENEQEKEYSELKDKNPELYELKKELNELKQQVRLSSKKTESSLVKEFISANPEISQEDLEATMNNLNPNLEMKEKLNYALNIMSAQGKLKETSIKAYKDAYAKQTASFVGAGNNAKVDMEKETQEDLMKKKFNDPNTFSPGIRKLLEK